MFGLETSCHTCNPLLWVLSIKRGNFRKRFLAGKEFDRKNTQIYEEICWLFLQPDAARVCISKTPSKSSSCSDYFGIQGRPTTRTTVETRTCGFDGACWAWTNRGLSSHLVLLWGAISWSRITSNLPQKCFQPRDVCMIWMPPSWRIYSVSIPKGAKLRDYIPSSKPLESRTEESFIISSRRSMSRQMGHDKSVCRTAWMKLCHCNCKTYDFLTIRNIRAKVD